MQTGAPSLNNFNFDENKFNNITGKFYVTNPSWITKNRNTFKALSINVDQSLCLIAEAATFTKLNLFPNKKKSFYFLLTYLLFDNVDF